MRELRDIVYFDTNLDEFNTRFYGVNFSDFVKISPRKINNILLLDCEYWVGQYNQKTSLYYIENEKFEEFIEDHKYWCGDFCFVDFEESKKLDNIKPQELAELLYLGHKQYPLNISFFEELNNYYVYCGHDDGWRTKLYCKETKDIGEIISNTVMLNLESIKRRKKYPIKKEINDELLKLSEEGLLIDFSGIYMEERVISIPLYIIGNDLNMDEMYNNQKKLKYNSKFKGYLKQKNKSWTISDKCW